ncbi:MAG: hypothetical protein ACLFS8_06165 [Clostridia bacterium]
MDSRRVGAEIPARDDRAFDERWIIRELAWSWHPKAVTYFALLTQNDVLTVPLIPTPDGVGDISRRSLNELIPGP